MIIYYLCFFKANLPPITTIAFKLDDNYTQNLNITEEPIKQIKFANIESYFNYRTIDEDFKLVSSILSDKESFIQLEADELNGNFFFVKIFKIFILNNVN